MTIKRSKKTSGKGVRKPHYTSQKDFDVKLTASLVNKVFVLCKRIED